MSSSDMVDVAQSLADLTPEQRALLVLRMRRKAPAENPGLPPLRPVPRPADGAMPLSFSQQRLWFMEHWQPGSAAYNIPAALRITGPLDLAALRWAFDEIVRRHEVLRVRIDSSRPVQIVGPPEPLPIPEVDLAALPEPARHREAARLAQAEIRRPFDLTHDLLLRKLLLRLGETEHVAVFNMHHIVSDGWSVGILAGELSTLYGARVQGLPSPLPELPLQYADYAVWQREWLQGEALEAQLAYWRQALDGAPAETALPLARPRPAVRSGRGARCPYRLGEELVAPLKALAQREGATVFVILLAALDTLLHRYSGETDLVVGSPVAGRGRAELEGPIGFFVNNLALRADLSGDPAFRALVGRLREVTIAAQAHQDLPFEKLVEELRPERDTSRPPVFQVVLSLQNTPRAAGGLEGLEIAPLAVDGGTAAYDLMISAMEEDGEGVHGFLEYSTDLFDAPAAARLAEHFQALLAGAAADPGRRLSELPLLSAAERWQILGEWNDTAVAVPQGCFHELWAERAAVFADAVAVAFEEERLSYGELDRRANLLAHHLRSLGVGPEVLVGIVMERSIEMVVAILAVWKAGGAYVPLDPSHPEERLEAVIGETGLLVLVTQERVLPRLPRFFGFTVAVDGEWEAIAAGPADDPRVEVQPGSLAYAIFTSGSTGRPKGVLLPHAGLLHLARAHEALFGTGPGESLLLVAPLVFDAAVFDLVMALWRGNTLWLARQEELLPGPALARLLADERITSLTITPSALAALPLPDGSSLPALRRLWVAGEACTPDLVARWAPGRRFFNAYGPTEATVWVTVEEVGELGEGAVTSIGRPVVNRRVQVLDPRRQPVPAGAVGELCAGGAALARGYLDRPDLTAERFVPDPFAAETGEPGARLYRTGDLVRHLADGRLEFVGRNDRQVKVRGVRIEPGEVEAALSQHPAVREAAVVASGVGEGRRLAAFASVQPGEEPEGAELRAFLRERLPETLVPSSFTLLPDLPRTNNGKLDRRALELIAEDAPAGMAAPAGEGREAHTPAQELAAVILAGVLGVERAGLEDNFFDLGGHSLLATQVLSRVRETFGVEIALADFFEEPTARGLAARCEAALRAGGVPVPPLVAAPREGELPLSFAQQRLWFLQQLEPGSTVYNIPGGVRLRGELDLAALAGSLGEIVRRHEVLRTTFPAVAGRPVQEIAPWHPLDIPVIDLAGLPAEAREAEARRMAEDEAGRPFDLARGPLLRLSLLNLEPDEHVLLFTMHHIVSDGWSMGVLIDELARLYPAALAGEPSPLPELRVQYADFAGWQRQWLQRGVMDAQLAYWKERLAGLPPLLELPADRPRPAVLSGLGRRLSFSLGAPLSEALRQLSRERGTTLFMTLFAGFQALLARLSGQDDFAVGTPIAGRNRMEIEGLIGFFVNTLVLRADLERDGAAPAFQGLLARVRETALGAYAHQDLPFEQIVEELRPERSLSQTPLFQVMFALQNVPSGSLDLPGLALEPLGVEPGTARFDLTVEVIEGEQELHVQAEHSADLFDATTVERLLAGFGRLLAAACEAPEARLDELPLLSAAERQQLLVEWNDTARGREADACLQALIERQAHLTPARTALTRDGERLSYGELNRRANRLAHRLRRLGVGPEARVGVLLERSPEMVVTLLAVLKAGGAYVALDPGYPGERLAAMSEDAGLAVLVTEERLLPVLPAAGETVVLCLDSESLEAESGDDPESLAVPGNLAYLIYTSGSTGRPKAVAIEHRSAAALVRWAAEVFAPEELAGVLASTSTSFDLSVFELFVPLALGGRVVLAANALELPAIESRDEVTLLNTVPSAMAELAAGPLPASLRTVNLAGEPLQARLVEEVFRHPQVKRLWNLYGPSEDTTYSTFARVEEDGKVTVGRPVSGTRVVLLDPRSGGTGETVLMGAVGELCLGGAGLARGYLGRPELTAERFVPDPSSGEAGERLYRTGDLARFLADGRIELLGRIDHQVKVRGFRIELGEIEAALLSHAGVREAVALARQDTTGGRTLAAYVVPGEPRPDPGELRRFLSGKLPSHMVPSAFVLLDALPLTPNGKVDRRALAELAPTADGRPGTGAVARTPVEEVLAAVWGEVLGRDRVGPEDDFFDLGGHSLLAAQVMSRVRSAFGVELPLRSLFEAPTVAGLAHRVEAALRTDEKQELPIRPVPRDGGPLPLSFAQERLWFLEQLQPGTATYNMATAVFLDGPLDLAAFTRALGTVIERHESLRTRFLLPAGDGRQPVQVIDPPPAWPLPVADLSGLPEERREELAQSIAEAESRRPFDLAAGPILRPLLLRLSPDRHLAVLAMHHIVSDAWSMSILVREVTELYTAYAAGEPSPLASLAPIALQYADFAAWQRQWLAGEVLERQLAFWRGRLAGAPPAMALPLDHPRRPLPSAQTFRGDKRPFSLGADALRELHALSRRSGTTLFMTLLAAFDALLHRWTGDADLVVGTPSANRNREEIEGVIGFFVNSLALRVDLAGDPDVPALLARVRETTLAAYTHQDLPFEKIVAELETERDLSCSPVFQVMFQLQNAAASALELPGLTLRFPEVETHTTKFDLMVTFHESPEGLGGEWRFNAGLFDAATVQRLTRHFAVLLEGIAARLDRPVSELPWLTEAERHQTLIEWNAEWNAEPALDVCYPDLFRERAAATPDAVAVAWEEVHLSYADLDRRSEAAAWLLARHGVGPDTVVGLLARRGPELPVAVLAIQKAGGAWMPLDPAQPAARLAKMIEGSGAACLVNDDVGEGLAPSREGASPSPTEKEAVPSLRLSELLAAPPSPERLPARLQPGNIAYLLYTSGSTGIPKGVMVTHRGLREHMLSKRAYLGLTAGDVVAQTAAPTFDISVWQLFSVLLAGGRVQMLPGDEVRDPARLLAAAEREGITVLQLVPSLLRALCEVAEETPDRPGRPELAALRWLIPTGEALPPDLGRRWLALYPGIPMVDAYGPTECTDEVSHQVLRDARLLERAVTPIGRPSRGIRLQVLDPGFRPVPIGVTGELCVVGAAVGRGYRHDPARTAEAFVPDPFARESGDPGARLYRTGDLARRLPDGTLEYLGRRDRQVKIRGFRIETGEVEAALRAHPEVREAAVLARPVPGTPELRLVAYVVTEGNGEGLRAFLAERLPDSMVPAAFVILDSLPLSANGKLDVRALPEPEAVVERAVAEPPRTPLEREIAALWQEALGTDRFGVHDNFFELGGDSIKGAILMHRLQRRLDREISVVTLFDAPTVAGLAARLGDAGTPHGQRRLAPMAPIARRDWSRETPPLSFAQERLWFLHLLDPEGSVYNMPNAFRLRGQLEPAVLDRALCEVVRRHETLRTRFEARDGLPVPVLEPAPRSLLAVADLAALPEALRDAEARRLFTAEAARPFDLSRGPVVRSLLLRLATEEHGVLFVAHHIACDGWSMGLWAREVEALYTAFALGQPSPLPEPAVQYADFASWQRSRLAGEDLTAELEHWRQRLQGAPPYLDLPTDRPRPAVQTFRGEWEMASLPGGLAADLRALGQSHNASLFMVMLAAFQLLLARLSGQDDVVVGSPIAGRVPEAEGLIGCFLNTLVLRTDLSGAPAFAGLLGRVRETALDAFAHQDVPYEKLLEVLRPERDLSRNSLFQVLFNMLNAPTAEVRLPGVEIEGEGLAEASSKFDLTLYVADQGGDGIVLNLVYNADLFDRARIQEMLRQYESLLAQAVAAPDAGVASYSLLTPEAAAVLPDPAAALGGRWEGAVHDLFAEWAARQPDRVALADRDGEWTYGELDVAVQGLAARLMAGGIEPGDRVAIYAHRSAALAWALLGVLKAGAAFVILDPIYPAARLVEILRLSQPTGWLRLEGAGPLPEPLATCVAETPFRVRLHLPAGGPEAAASAFAWEGDVPLPETWPPLGPDDVASHAFTSGSTGVPKGIVQTHGSMSFFLPWHRDVLGYGEADRHTMLSGLAHDPLQRDVFYSLGSGAALCIPDPDRIGEPGYLAEWMRRERVTVTNLTPAMAQLVTEGTPHPLAPSPTPSHRPGEGEHQLPHLRCVVLAGDILTRLDVDRVRRLAPQARLVNVYGSTESHRALSYHLITEAGSRSKRGKQVLPLGRGKRGCQLLVLTASGHRAGVGELGEVAIRSRHMAAGYLKDEALTRERFVPNPFTQDPADRLYRTGDLGRYRPDGEVEAAGRADQQVKIRGYRVEPGEIEAELGRIPGVRETVVVGRDDPAGGKRLVAYLVLDSVDVGEAELRELLRERLPAYMVPAVFVALDELPLNPNGKVDRRALPEPAAQAGTVVDRRSVPPRDELERTLVRIWEEVLGTAPIGVTDGFFDLGGHSLLAVRLTARIARELGQTLPLAALFQAPTVEQMALLLRRRSPMGDSALVPLRPGGSRTPLFLVHPAGGQVFSYTELVRWLGPGQPVYGLQDTALADAPRTLAGLAARYLKEVRAVQPRGPYLLAGWSFGGRVAHEMARQLDAAGEEVAFVGMLDTGLVQPPATALGDAELLAEVVGELPLSLDELRRADDPLAALVERARQTGALAPDITLESARHLLDVFKAHLEVARTDRPQPYRGRVVFFAAEIQPPEIAADPSHGWSRLAGALELRRVPGDHVTMIHNAQNVRVVAERLAESIEEALAEVAAFVG